jgi:hypothetical protein
VLPRAEGSVNAKRTDLGVVTVDSNRLAIAALVFDDGRLQVELEAPERLLANIVVNKIATDTTIDEWMQAGARLRQASPELFERFCEIVAEDGERDDDRMVERLSALAAERGIQ